MAERSNNFEKRPMLLKNFVQHYAWGSRGEAAFIPRLLGKEAEQNVPYAELWIGAHPKAPSKVFYRKKWVPLDELIKKYPEHILGKAVNDRFAGLPFLFKVLSAAEPLSIQAHPSKAQAKILHARDPVNYPDDNHKPEIAIALDHLTALAGFRNKTELEDILERHPEIADFLGSEVLAAFHEETDEAKAIRLLYHSYLERAAGQPHRLEEMAGRLRQKVATSTPADEVESLFLAMADKYGLRDIGLFSIFFLNLLRLKAGEALFLGAGIPHAYVKGNIVECMANSDNVVRAGLTPKYQDVRALLDILDYGCKPVVFRDVNLAGSFSYNSGVDEFQVSRRALRQGERTDIPTGSVTVLLLMEGEATVSWSSRKEKMAWQKGQSLLIPGAVDHVSVEATQGLLFFQINVPV